MGLFDMFKKKEEITWDQGVKAELEVLTAEGQPALMVVSIVEGQATIVPMDPERMYKVDEYEEIEYKLSLVNKKGDIIADLPFYSCIPYLVDYVLERKSPFVLLKPFESEDIKYLIQEVSKDLERNALFNQLFRNNLEFLKKGSLTVEQVNRAFFSPHFKFYTFENVNFPTGEIVAVDPICYLQDVRSVTYLKERVAPGKYPITVAIEHKGITGIRMVGMRLKVSDKSAVSYHDAEAFKLVEGEEKVAMSGFPVDAGMSTFCDKKAAEAYWSFLKTWYEKHEGANLYDDYLAELFKRSYEAHPDLQREDGDFIRLNVEGSDQEIVMVATGFGDGYYSVFWGRDEEGEITELVTLFIDPDLIENPA